MHRITVLLSTAVLLLVASPAMAAAEAAQDESQFDGVVLAFVFGLVVGALAFLQSETRGRRHARREEARGARRTGEGA